MKKSELLRSQDENGEGNSCLRCGECCRIRGFVRVTAGEIDTLAEFLCISQQDFIDRFTRLGHDRQGLELKEREDGECVLLKGSDCIVHPVKPGQCRTFPDKWRYDGVWQVCPTFKGSK